MKVMIVGSIPPPIGGVTIHIQRFFDRYKHDTTIDLSILDIKKNKYYFDKSEVKANSSIAKILLTDVVHIQISSNIKILIAFLAKLFRKKVVYTHHNIRIKSMFFFKVFMIFVDKLILVNDRDIPNSIKRYKYDLIPAFLPSTEEENLPSSLINMLESYDNIISTNCFQMTYINGKDLYGFDLCVDAFKKLVAEKNIKNSVLVLVDPSATTKDYVEKLLTEFVEENNCAICYVDYMINFNELIKLSTMVLRATRSDGDSITVREAIYLKTPVIASDVTYRPKGTITFQHENSDDLSDKISFILNDKIIFSDYDRIDYADKVVQTYKNFFYGDKNETINTKL